MAVSSFTSRGPRTESRLYCLFKLCALWKRRGGDGDFFSSESLAEIHKREGRVPVLTQLQGFVIEKRGVEGFMGNRLSAPDEIQSSVF